MTPAGQAPPPRPPRTGAAAWVARAVRLWALAGGVVLLVVVAANVFEVATAALLPLTGYRFTGAVELTELGAAVALFCFLPWCQLHDAHVRADVFTAGAGPRAVAFMGLAAALVGLVVFAVLLWRMTGGLSDQRAFGYRTAILSLPVWWAYVPVIVSLALTAVAALVRVAETARDAARPALGHRG